LNSQPDALPEKVEHLTRPSAKNLLNGPLSQRTARGEQWIDVQLDGIGVSVVQHNEPILDVEVELVGSQSIPPAIIEETRVVSDVFRLTAPRSRLQVIGNTSVAVVHLVSPLAQAQAEIRILEAVAKGAVEASRLLENRTSNQRARRGDGLEAPGPIYCRMAGREASIDVAGPSVSAHDHTGVLDRVVRKQELGADDGRRGIAPGVVKQGIKPAVLGDGVVVQEDEVASRSRSGTLVACRGKATVRFATKDKYILCEPLKPAARPIGGPIVYNDDLERDSRGPEQDCLQALDGEPQVIVNRNNDRALRHDRNHRGCR
jgi:hypothetical protein